MGFSLLPALAIICKLSFENGCPHNFKPMFRISHRRYSVKKVFFKISQNSQENTCARVSFFKKVACLRAATIKKRFWHRCFPVNFAKCLRTPFLQNISGQLLLHVLKNMLIDLHCFFLLITQESLKRTWHPKILT